MSEALSDGELSSIPAMDVRCDAWLSGVLEKRALQIVPEGEGGGGAKLTGSLAGEAVLATAKVAVEDTALVGRLQDIGFRIVDTALTFECETLPEDPSRNVRFAHAQDRDRIMQIAGNAFRYSRFHLDPMISNQLADRVKAEWAANYFNGARGDAMVVGERETNVAGFLLLLRDRGDSMIIDLIAVDPEHTRCGLARAMIAFAAHHGCGDGRRPTSILVGTQAANTPSVRLYESMGFRLCGAQHVLHYHGDGSRILELAEAIQR